MVIKIENNNKIFEPQTALDHVFLEELSKSGCVTEAYALSRQALSLSGQYQVDIEGFTC